MHMGGQSKTNMVPIWFTESQILPPSKRIPIKDILLFCRQQISESNNSIQGSHKIQYQGSTNSSLKSKLKLRNLDIQSIFGRKRLIGIINGGENEVKNNTSTESASDHENAWEISDFSSMNDSSKKCFIL